MLVPCICTQCGRRFQKERGQLTRALKASPGRLYCSRRCTGLARRRPRLPLAERRAKKAAYDLIRRTQMRDELNAEKRERYHATKSYEKGRALRARQRELHGASYHTDYCREYFRDPKRKAHKVRYDQRRRDSLRYGEYAASALLLRKLLTEIRRRSPDYYERLKARGYYTKPDAQKRRRDAHISRW